MTDMPSFGILCCGKDIKELALSVKCCTRVSGIMKGGGFSLSGYHTLISSDSAESRKLCADKMYHLCRVCDVLLTIGCDGFSRDDIVPEVMSKLCGEDLVFFTSNLCGLSSIGNYDKGRKRDVRKKFIPTRSRSGILRETLVLNIRNDENFIYDVLPGLLPAISFACSGLCGKDADESRKFLCEFETQFLKKGNACFPEDSKSDTMAENGRIVNMLPFSKHKK